MDTRQTLARFEAERQALALMDHPNIARVLDAGATQTGRPYFVMELVKGVPLTEYCDANRLSTPERLALFIEVCHAVQHAHQKGIIHRDLKPSNVLVALHDGKPVPKIIDFGVAKATSQRLTEKTMFTSYGQMIGTPAYMSPEQAEMGGLDVDTRSDIYALGVLLYELLTGTTPFDEKHLRTAGYQEIQRIIREVEPLKPSTRLGTLKDTLASVAAQRHTEPARLARLVRGDLDWIVMKTLEKDRARRYETADGLILDIQHHLAHEPVLAGPPGAAYRARKFLRRHRTGAVAGLLVFLALAAGLAAATVGLLRARDSARAAEQEADRATQEAAKAEAVTRFFQETLEAIDPEKARGREVTVREVFDNAAKDIGTKFAGQPLVEAAVRETLGKTYLALGDYAAAHSQLSSAFGIRRQILGEEHPDTLKSMMNLGWALLMQHESAQAEQMYRQVLEVQERVRGKEHPDTLKSMMNLAIALCGQGKYAEAEQMHRQVLEVRERVLGKEHPDTLSSMMNLANALHNQGKYAEAEQMHRQVLEVEKRVFGKEHLYTLQGMTNLANTLNARGKAAEAEQMHRQVLEVQERVRGKEHPDTLLSMNNLASALRMQGKYAQAEQGFRRVIEIAEKMAADLPSETNYRVPLVRSLSSLGRVLREDGRPQEAARYILKALDAAEQFAADSPGNAFHDQALAVAHDGAHHAWSLATSAEPASREPELAAVLATRAVRSNPESAWCWQALGAANYRLGNYQVAVENLEKSIDLQKDGGNPWQWFFLAMAYGRLGDSDAQAEQAFRRVIEIAEKMAADLPSKTNDRVYLVRSLHYLSHVLRDEGRPQEAARYILKALDAAEQVAADSPGNAAYHDQAQEVARCGADHAWSLATSAEPASREPELAAVLATRAVRSNPESASCWQALGAANYRLGNYQIAVENLEKSIDLQKDGGDPWQWFFLAMAHGRLGHSDAARQWFDRGVRWMQERRNRDEIPRRLWAEAAALLGIAYPPPLKPVTPEVRAAWQGEMQRRARAIKAAVVEQGQQVPVDVLPEALWRYTQPGKQEGSLWACGRTGRPVALVGMEFYPPEDGGAWGSYEFVSLLSNDLSKSEASGVWGSYEFVSLSSGHVTAAGEGDWKWSPKKPGAEFKPLPDGPAPAEDAAGRLGQMKELLRRFTASEKPLPGKELALLEAPVHRYADAERGLLDGAVFVFADGTNPEVILLMELRRADKASPPQWQYALARMSAAQLRVNLDGTEVWRRPGGKMKPEDEYAVFGAPYLPK
jgi:tetratricopeptide (TPR) repeat protein